MNDRRQAAIDLLEELVDQADEHDADEDFSQDRTVKHLIREARIILKRPRRDPPENPREPR